MAAGLIVSMKVKRDKIINSKKVDIRSRAIQKNIEYNLDDWNYSWPSKDPLGFILKCNKDKAKDDSVSIDRIDNSKGYTIENCQIVSNRYNKIKNDATPLELLKIGIHSLSLFPLEIQKGIINEIKEYQYYKEVVENINENIS